MIKKRVRIVAAVESSFLPIDSFIADSSGGFVLVSLLPKWSR